MVRFGTAFLLVAFLLAGCGFDRGNGPDFATMSKQIGPPRAGQVRIVVMRELSTGGPIDPGWEVELDGAPMGSMKAGTYIYADRPAGRHELTGGGGTFPGVSRREVAAQAGRTYFILTKISDRARAMTATSAFGGLAGMAVGAMMTSDSANPGPYDFVLLEEEPARSLIANMQLAQ